MATLKQRLHRKNASGTYDIIHFETSADLITGTLGIAHGGTGASDATTARNNLGAAASSHTHDDRYYTESETNNLLNAKANSSHTHSASQVSSGTFSGAVYANAAAMATIWDSQVRSISAGTTDLSPGSSSLTTGAVYLVYE